MIFKNTEKIKSFSANFLFDDFGESNETARYGRYIILIIRCI